MDVRAPAEIIRERASRVVQGALNDDVGFARWVKQMIAHTVTEYQGRFLHELIQNGYDAHPPDTTAGRLAVHFDEAEGEHGVLYVANGGNPLTEDNFTRMASLADSDKDIGVGIGNKGIGFKSVFQICHVPEVYSARDLDDPGYGGFTFRFGTMGDLVAELDGDAELAEQVEGNLSLSLLTVPLDEVPGHVAAYRREGYVTVLRLPAVSPAAADAILDRIGRLVSSPAPVMLFLERLESLSVRSRRNEEATVLTRKVVPGELWDQVALDGDTFRLFTAQIPPSLLRAALEQSVEIGALDRRWLAWNSAAHISIAVGDGSIVDDGRLFTFLPMGDDAESPLDGHINAPFVTNLARLGLDHEQPVNKLMIRCAAAMCLWAATVIAEEDGDATTALDLVAWRQRIDVLDEVCQQTHGCDLAHLPVLPTRGHGWRALSETYRWDEQEVRVITGDALTSHCGAVLADPERIAPDRIEAAANLSEYLDVSLDPDEEQIADWVTALATALHERNVDLASWAAFYDDLPLVLDSGEALRSRAILLSADGSLARCDEPASAAPGTNGRRRRHRTAFFSPRARGERAVTEDATDDELTGIQEDDHLEIRPPRSLRSRLTFMHPGLDWYEGQQRRPGREFLETNHLVQPFRTERLLGLMARALSETPSEALKRDSLHYAFRLLGGQPDRHARDLTAVGLHVPTQTGTWIPAPSARFGSPWTARGASDLTQLMTAATEDTPEFASLQGVLVADPTSLPGGSDGSTAIRWQSFLATLGVTDTLPIQKVSDTRAIRGRDLTTDRLAAEGALDGVPPGVVEQWRDGIDEAGNLNHPETAFTTSDPVYWLLGQHEVEQLPSHLRSRYANLVIRTIPTLEQHHRWSTWRRRQPNGTDSRVPTPLECFLDCQPWVPNQCGGGEPEFRWAEASWYAASEDQMAAYYSPLVAPQLRRILETQVDPQSIFRITKLRVWGSRADSAALIDHLADLFESSVLGESAAAAEHFRTSLADAWNVVGDPDFPDAPGLEEGLLVERRGQLELLEPGSAGDERVFVIGTHDNSTAAKLVRELGWPTVSVNTENPERLREIEQRVLRPRWHDEIVVTPDWDIEVLVDGEPWQAGTDACLLTEAIPWLQLVYACTMRFPRAGTPVGKHLEDHMNVLARIRLLQCSRLSIVTAAGEQPLPTRLHDVLPIPGEEPTLLIQAPDAQLTWGQLESVTSAALELMGQTRFTAELALTLRKLATGPDLPAEPPDMDELAEALGVEPIRVTEVEARVCGTASAACSRLLPAAVCLWGEQVLDALSADVATSIDETVAALTRFTGNAAKAAHLLELAAKALDANAVRLAQSIPLADYNAVLAQYFPSAPPVDNSTRFAEEFQLRRSQRRPELVDRLRAHRFPAFAAGRPQPDWTEVRTLEFLTPDPAWGTARDVLPNEIIDDHIDQQFAIALGAGLAAASRLPDTAEVREANSIPLRQRLATLQEVALAWHQKNKTTPGVSLGPDFVDEAIQALDAAGALDFVPLDDDLLVAWMNRLSVWPTPMPLTVDRLALGVSDADLSQARTDSAAARDERLRAERQITVHGEVMTLDLTMGNLIERLSSHLATSPASLATPYRFTRPQTLAPNSGRASGSPHRQTRSAAPTRRLSEPQRNGIGLAGELTAYHWLRSRERSPVDESCWKSTYASFIFAGHRGDDSLGYDFAVPRADGAVMYEVKATSGDASMIELGESEVACAQEHAKSSRWRLLVVEDVLSAEPRVLMLPNPFGRDARSLYRFVGNSIRLRFRL